MVAAGWCRNFCLLRTKKAKQLRLDAPMVPRQPICASTCPKQAPPLRPERDIQRQQSERKDYRLFCQILAYVTKTTCQETQRDTITNLTAKQVRLHCSHCDLNVGIHDGICLRLSVSVATNYLCFVSTILCFYEHFFNVILFLQMQLLTWGGGLYM